MGKVLVTASTQSHILHFHLPYLQWFRQQGWQVHVAFGAETGPCPHTDKQTALPLQKRMWAWQNFAAVKACYRYLGCEDHAAGWFRPGQHRHKLPDFTQFLDFMERVQKGQELSEHLQINPYPEIPLNFEW